MNSAHRTAARRRLIANGSPVAQQEPDENLRKFYAMLSVEWEKEATK